MNIESIRTEDGINLKGLFLENINNDRVCLFIPGCCGNFIDNDFIRNIGIELMKSNYNFLCGNTRGSFMINSSFHPQNLEKPKQIGATFEKFEDCIYDIDAWINFLINRGYKQIDIICHSSGSNKFIYYMNCDIKSKQFINNVILLSPADFANKIRTYDNYEDLLKEAKNNVISNNQNKLINVHFFYRTSLGFLEMMDSKNFDNIPLVTGNKKDFSQYSSINKNLYIIYGSNELHIKKYISKLINYANPNIIVECSEIIGADHVYFNKEKIVSQKIVEYLDKSYLMSPGFSLLLKKESK